MYGLCRYGPQQMASLTYGISMPAAPREGMVHGTKGNIKLHASMHALNKFTVHITGKFTVTCMYYNCSCIERLKPGQICVCGQLPSAQSCECHVCQPRSIGFNASSQPSLTMQT